MLRIAFIMEQHLGHLAFYQNVRRFVADYPDIQPTWIEFDYSIKDSLFAKIPLLRQRIRGTLAGYLEVRAGLERGNYDALVFNTQVPAALAGSLLKKQPYIICTDITPIQYDRMATHYHHQPDRPGMISRYKNRVNTNVFQNAGYVLPWSTWTRSSLIEDYGTSPEKIIVNPPGVDLDVWRPGKRDTSGPLRVLFVGGDFYRKGGELLLEACQGIPEGTVELVLVTRSAIPEKKWITIYNDLQPNSAKLIELYQSCDVFVLPTQAEAFGIAAVEACAAGLPVLATPVGGLIDIIDDGVNGYLIQLNQPELLRNYLLRLAHNPLLRQQMGQASRLKAEMNFNAQVNVSSMVNMIYSLTGHSSMQQNGV